jgi:hypothetical protein
MIIKEVLIELNAQGHSIPKIAKQIGINRTAVFKWSKSDAGVVRSKNARKLCDFFGYDLQYKENGVADFQKVEEPAVTKQQVLDKILNTLSKHPVEHFIHLSEILK